MPKAGIPKERRRRNKDGSPSEWLMFFLRRGRTARVAAQPKLEEVSMLRQIFQAPIIVWRRTRREYSIRVAKKRRLPPPR